jgi:hypothetical protein
MIFYSAISIFFFLFWADRTRLRKYYSALLTINYLRFLEQYVFVYVLKVWEYKHLPIHRAKVIDVPILLDVTLFPMLGYFLLTIHIP